MYLLISGIILKLSQKLWGSAQHNEEDEKEMQLQGCAVYIYNEEEDEKQGEDAPEPASVPCGVRLRARRRRQSVTRRRDRDINVSNLETGRRWTNSTDRTRFQIKAGESVIDKQSGGKRLSRRERVQWEPFWGRGLRWGRLHQRLLPGRWFFFTWEELMETTTLKTLIWLCGGKYFTEMVHCFWRLWF